MKASDIKRGIPPEQFYRYELPDAPHWKLGASGWVSGGLCPFHHDARAGSFRVNLATGAYCCFSCGARGGDIIAFEQQRRGVGFLTALAGLSEAWRCA